MSEEKGFITGTVVISFLVGGLVGAGVALLMAPQSGTETRENIKDLADDAKDKIRDTYRHGKVLTGLK